MRGSLAGEGRVFWPGCTLHTHTHTHTHTRIPQQGMTLTATKPQVDRGSPNSAVPLVLGLARRRPSAQGAGCPWNEGQWERALWNWKNTVPGSDLPLGQGMRGFGTGGGAQRQQRWGVGRLRANPSHTQGLSFLPETTR